MPPPELSGLQNFYLLIAFVSILTYSIFSVGAWFSPFGLSQAVILWLYIGGFFPFLIFFWSIFQFRFLMQKIKKSQIKQINTKIQLVINEFSEDLSKERVDILNGLMDAQVKVKDMKEWALTLKNILTFLVTFLVPVAQVIVSVISP
jgi:hypothetical protein